MNELKLDRVTLVVLVGPPASGKSTWGKEFSKKSNVVYISTDSIRAEIGKGEGDQTVSAATFVIAQKRVREALAQGKSVVIDATNCDGAARRPFVKIAKDLGADKIAVAFEIPNEELYRRDAQRERHVGKEIIDVFVGKYSRPNNTNFDKVIINPK